MNAPLAFEDVEIRLGNRTVVSGVTCSVGHGEVLAVCGPNGAGKSTLLRAAASLVKLQGGSILLYGRPLHAIQPGERARQLAFVAQQPATPDAFLVRDVVSLGRIPHASLLGNESTADRASVARAMARAGVTEFAARRLGQLSGGERQRVSIARALAQEPRVLLLDEPTSNLDLRHQASILALIRQLAREEGLSAVVVLHDLSLAALFCDRLLLLSEGCVVRQGAPGEVLAEELLTGTYGTPLRVLAHPETGAPLVTHAVRGGSQ